MDLQVELRYGGRATRPRIAVCVALSLCAVLLAACHVDDGASGLTVNDSQLTLVGGGSASLLAQDHLGEAPAVAGSGGNVLFELLDPTLPLAVDDVGLSVSADGVVHAGPRTQPGTWDLHYRLCDAALPTNCAVATVSLAVSVGPLGAHDDDLVLMQGEHASLLGNDEIASGGALLAGDYDVVATEALPAGVLLSLSGGVAIDASAGAGSRRFGYRVCERRVRDNCASAQVHIEVPATGALHGQAERADYPVASAAGKSASLGGCYLPYFCFAPGLYTLAGLPADPRTVVNYDWPFGSVDLGFGGHYLPASTAMTVLAAVRPGRVSPAAVDLSAIGETATFNNADGTTVASGSAHEWRLTPDSVRLADGSTQTTAQALLTVYDTQARPASVPGDYSALVGGRVVALELYGVVQFGLYLRDESGQLAPGLLRTASSARLPVSGAGFEAPATATLWQLDTASARWQDRGPVSRVDGSDGAWYEATIAQPGTWAVGRPIATRQVSGCVQDAAGRPLAGATVRSESVNPAAVNTARSDASGRYSVAVRAGSAAQLRVLDDVAPFGDASPLSALAVGPLSADLNLATCLAGAGEQYLLIGYRTLMAASHGTSVYFGIFHLLAPDGSELLTGAASSLVAAPYVSTDTRLELDDGERLTRLSRLQVGTYRLELRPDGVTYPLPQEVRAWLLLPGRARQDFDSLAPHPVQEGQAWRVFEFDVDAHCGIAPRRVLQIAVPTLPASRPAAWCTP